MLGAAIAMFADPSVWTECWSATKLPLQIWFAKRTIANASQLVTPIRPLLPGVLAVGMTGLAHESMALRLYRSHRAALVDYAKDITGSRAHAEDVVQEAWLHLDRKGDDPLIREPIAYFYRIVRNLAIDSIRRSLRERAQFGESIEEAERIVSDEKPSAEAAIIARDDIRLVIETLAELPDRQRIAIEMYRFGGFKLREIANRLGVSIGLVHLLIAQGLEACDRRRNEE